MTIGYNAILVAYSTTAVAVLLDAEGKITVDGFKKVKHRIIMGSQEKANTAEDMDNWLLSINKKIVLCYLTLILYVFESKCTGKLFSLSIIA